MEGSGLVPLRETNSSTAPSAYAGVKSTRLKGPAVGKTSQQNGALSSAFKGKRGR